MEIKPREIASAIFGGFAVQEFAQGFLDLVGNILNATGRALRTIGSLIKNAAKGWLDWFRDDAVGATAGALLVIVVLVVAGAAVGAVSGGVAALMSAGVVGKLAVLFGGLTLAALVGVAIRFAVRGFMFVWNFNWNITDSDIAQQQQALITSLYGAAGEALGTAIGTACGTGVVELAKRFKVVKFNPVMMARIKEVSEWKLFDENGKFNRNAEPPELYEEMMEGFGELLTLTQNQASRYAFLEAYKNTRRIIKAITQVAGVAAVFPEFADMIERWGAEESDAWSFAIAVEERIENIDNERLQQFVEELYESALDSCLESLMIVSYAFG